MLYTMVNAQTKPVELFHLVRMLTPDSAKTTALNDWNTASAANSPIKWASHIPKDHPVGYIKSGSSNVSFDGKNTANTGISLIGHTMDGYSEVQFSTTPPLDNGIPSYALEKLLGAKKFTANLIKVTEGTYPTYYYDLKIPGKKPIWIIMFAERMEGVEAAVYTLNIDCFFDKVEFDIRNKP